VPPSRSQADFGRWLLGLLPSAATAIAEGAWIAVVYGALQFGMSERAGTMGPWAFIAIAASGMFLVRVAPSGLAHDTAVIGLVIGAAVAGWLSDPAVRAVAADGRFDALAPAGSGWLLGIAAWRGTRHRDPLTDDTVVGALLAWIVPCLAIPWLIGSGSSQHQAFVDTALPATLLFVTAGLIAVGLTRLEALGQLVGVDWRRNRAWVAMLVGVVGLVALIATPTAWLLDASAEASARTLLGPAAVAADVVGAIAAPIEDTIGGFLPGSSPAQPAFPPGGAPKSAVATWIEAFVLTGVLTVLVGVLLVFHRIMTSEPRSGPPPPELQERQTLLPPPLPGGLGWIHLPRIGFRRESVPGTASQAYLAVLDRLDRDERLRRVPSESPAAHARRLRTIGAGALSLDLLAADFELERYRGATLTPSETRRAIERSRFDSRPWRNGPVGARR
jgi:hypothetical protein